MVAKKLYFTKADQKKAKARKDHKWAMKHYYTVAGRASRLISTAKCRAKKKGRCFTLTPEWAKERLEVGICELSGLPFELGEPTGKGRSAGPLPYAPSIDRIDQDKGYTVKNSRMILNCLNAFKNIMSDDDMFKIMQLTLAANKSVKSRPVDFT